MAARCALPQLLVGARPVARRSLIAAGIYGQNIYVLPSDDLVVAKFSTWPTPLSDEFSRQT